MDALTQSTKITVSDINTLISECNSKLNLSGGAMTGAISWKHGFIQGNGQEMYISACPTAGYDDGTYAAVAIRPREHNASGSVALCARNEEYQSYYIFRPTHVTFDTPLVVFSSSSGNDINIRGYNLSADNTTPVESQWHEYRILDSGDNIVGAFKYIQGNTGVFGTSMLGRRSTNHSWHQIALNIDTDDTSYIYTTAKKIVMNGGSFWIA